MATYPTGPISFSEIADALGVDRASGVSVTNLLTKLPAGGTTSFDTLRNASKGVQLTPNTWYIPSRANSIGSTSTLNITNVRYMTLTFWMYIGVTTTEWRSVLNFSPLNIDRRRPAMWIVQNGSTGFHLRNDTTVSINDGIWDTATVSPNPLNMKFFIAITWNNRTMNVYRNGQLLQTYTYSGDLLQPDSTYNIYSSTEFGYPITGGFKMAKVMYYPSTLGASKISELYNAEKNSISDDTSFPDVTIVNEYQLRSQLSAGTLIGGTSSDTTLYSQNNWVRLTSATTGVFGMLYFYEILGSYWMCQFDFFNDAVGDALWFAAYMTTAPSASTFMTEQSVATNGGGYRFVADDYEQSYQLHGPQANNVSGPVQNDGNYITHVASGNISNSVWRTMRIEFQQLSPTTNNIKMYINNVLTISTDHTPPNGYNVSHNSPCYFGFGARTGGAFGAHYVRNMSVTREIQTASTGIRFYHPDGRTVKLDGSQLRLNTGSEVTFDIYAGSDVYQSSNNRIAFFANGSSATSIRHASLVLYLNPFTANNYDWAWFIVRTGDNSVKLYNDYGGYFLGYDSSSDSLMIVPSNDSRVVDWRVSPMTPPMYTNEDDMGLHDNLSSTSQNGVVALYSFKLLKRLYGGPVIKVRRGSDNAVLDFYATTLGTISTGRMGTGTTLSSWLAGATGYLQQWYDQSGRGKHVVQNTAGAQPPIILQGTEYGIHLSGTYQMQGPNVFDTNTVTNCHIFMTMREISTINNWLINFNGTANATRFSLHAPWGSRIWFFDAGNAAENRCESPANITSVGARSVLSGYKSSADGKNGMKINQGTLYTSTSNTAADVTGGFVINSYQSDGSTPNHHVYSVMVYNTKLSSTDDAYIATNL
jgi:hypothetical protein